MSWHADLLLTVAASVILWEMIAGWRNGVVRQVVKLVALGASCAVAPLVGGWLVPLLRPLSFPDFVLRFVGEAAVALAVYAALCVIGGVLFKRTAQQGVGIVRLVYGASGALVGGVLGMVLVLLLALAIRVLGSIAEAAKSSMTPAPLSATAEGSFAEPAAAIRAPAPHAPLLDFLSTTKRELEDSPAGPVVAQVDPIPPHVYETFRKIGAVAADHEAIHRFFDYRGARELASNPRVLALRDDPAVAKLIASRQIVPLLRNPKVIAAANDPELSRKLRAFDLDKALDFALPKAEPTPP